MQNTLLLPRRLILLCLLLILAGCASEPAPAPEKPEQIISGEVMMRESQGIASLSERWKAGKQLVDRGTNMVNEGQAKIAEGNRLISEGNRVIQESEENYKNIKK